MKDEEEKKYSTLEEKYRQQNLGLEALKTEVKGLRLQTLKIDRRARLLNQFQTTPTPVTRSKVAFYVQLTHDLANIGNYQAIIFDLVTTNIGGHYNSNDGIFTAPQDGTYVFSWTTSNNDRSHMETELVVNGHVYGVTISDSADHDDITVASNTVVINLKANDTVWIRSNYIHTRRLKGQMSTFSGWLLYD